MDLDMLALIEADSDALMDALGLALSLADGVKSVNISHDIAPTSLFVLPWHVLVAAPAVIDEAVVNWKPVTLSSRSSAKFTHVFVEPASSPFTTAIMPPPVAIVVEPVVNTVSRKSVPCVAPVDE